MEAFDLSKDPKGLSDVSGRRLPGVDELLVALFSQDPGASGEKSIEPESEEMSEKLR